MKRTVSILSLMLALFVVSPNSAHATSNLRKATILLTMSESALAAVSLIQDQSKRKLKELSWSINYSQREWVFEAKGFFDDQEVNFTLSGFLWGQDKEDWLITYSGQGQIGKDPLRIHGHTSWRYDKEASDYQEMDFRQIIKFGDNSFWTWMFGAELVVGGTIGAVTGGGGTVIATGGLGLGAAPWIAAKGAAVGAAALVTISAGAKVLLDSDDPPPPPTPPKRPSPPSEGEKLVPQDGILYAAVSRDGRILGSGSDGVSILSGNHDSEDKTATGKVFVP